MLDVYLPNIATTLIMFMVRLRGASASPIMTATCPRPPPGTHATHSNPKRISLLTGSNIANPNATWEQKEHDVMTGSTGTMSNKHLIK